MDILDHAHGMLTIRTYHRIHARRAFHKHHCLVFLRAKSDVTASKSLTFKFNFDIIKNEHRRHSFFVVSATAILELPMLFFNIYLLLPSLFCTEIRDERKEKQTQRG